MKARTLLLAGLPLVALSLGSCGGGGDSDPAPFAVQQDLTLDPTGFTTVLDFATLAPLFGPGNLESDGGQVAQSVVVDGADDTRLIVGWNERVTPQHQVRVNDVAEVLETFVSVTTTDSSAPTFTITSATQGVGLGADTVQVAFSGPNVIASHVEDGANWNLVYGATTIDLAASTLSFDEGTQVLNITTDATANVHGSFELAVSGLLSVADVAVGADPVGGTATGDNVAPTLVSAVQNLNEDEFGRVIEFTFSEAMDPVFSASPISFSPGFPEFASSVSQTSPQTLRVRFDDPIVPGLATVQLIGVIDAHGNAYAGGNVDPVAGTTVANQFNAGTTELVTVEGIGGDQLRAATTQALAPEIAEQGAAWNFRIGGVPVPLADGDITYDLLQKQLTVDLDADVTNGTLFEIEAAALTDGAAPVLVDVDGEDFVSTFSATSAGDSVAPGVNLVLQNRNLDASGSTFDVHFSEDLDPTSVGSITLTSNNGPAVDSFSATSDPRLLRAVLTSNGLPGEISFDIAGAADPAGNTMVPVTTIQASSTDSELPTATGITAIGFEGPDNDTIQVTFDDDMWVPDLEAVWNWEVESPVGTPVATNLAIVSYEPSSRTATLEFSAGGFSFQADQEVEVDFVTVRDIAGNAYGAGGLLDTPQVEVEFPIIESIWVADAPNQDQVTIRFDELLGSFDDAFTRYELLDAGGAVIGTPTGIAASADGRGVVLSFGQAVVAGTNTVNVVGPTDLAGNSAFPAIAHPVDSADTDPLGFDSGAISAVAVSGEANDVLTVVFDRAPSLSGLTDPDNWSLATDPGGAPISLDSAAFSFDGDRTLTIVLTSGANTALQLGVGLRLGYTGLSTVQGVEAAGTVEHVEFVSGDSQAPTTVAGRVQLDPQDGLSVLIELSEAVDGTSIGGVSLNGGAVDASQYQLVGPRTARATFPVAPAVSDTVELAVDDLAGNPGSIVGVALTGSDSAAPIIAAGHLAEAVPGFGGDSIRIPFQEPIQVIDALDQSLYTVTFDGQPVSLSGAILRYSSVENTVWIDLPSGTEIPAAASVAVTVQDVRDHAGNPMAVPTTVLPPVGGDTTPPSIVQAFVNRRVDATGATVDVLFSEDVDPSAAQASSWTTGSGTAVQTASTLGDAGVRLVLAAPLGASDTVATNLVPDAALNLSGALSIDPVD